MLSPGAHSYSQMAAGCRILDRGYCIQDILKILDTGNRIDCRMQEYNILLTAIKGAGG